MIRVRIFEEDSRLSDIPQWWYNFCLPDYDEEELNQRLLDWSANFWVATTKRPDKIGYGDRYIDFYDESAYTWFMLRFT